MKIETVKLVRAFDRDVGSRLLVNGVEIASANYDDHGDAGAEVLYAMHQGLARLAGVSAEIADVDDPEFEAPSPDPDIDASVDVAPPPAPSVAGRDREDALWSVALVVTLVVLLLAGGRGDMISGAAQQIKFGIEDMGRSYEKATIGAACIAAGHRWEYGRCDFYEK
jgi:hypothetical protein